MPARKKTSSPLPRIQLGPYLRPEEYTPPADLGCLRSGSASENPCARCPGHCCHLLLSLTVHDVARICVGLGVPPTAFCRLEKRSEGWNAPTIDIEGVSHYLMLNSGGFLDDGSTKACIFLHNIPGAARCSIYTLRPMTCRLYPFRWWQDGQLSEPKKYWCPEGWLVGPQKKRSVVKAIKQSIREEQASAKLIQAFNRQRKIPHSADEFFRYAVAHGAEALGLDPSEVLQAPVRRRLGQRLW